MKKLIALIIVAVIACFMAGCGGGKSSSSSASSGSALAVPAINIDWNKAIEATKQDVLKQETLVQDINIAVKNDKKRITIMLACNNAINDSAALEAADTAIRRLSANAQMQDGSIKSAGKDYWGGIWDVYELELGVARLKDVDDASKWMIYDVVQPGGHGQHTFTVKK